MEHLVNDVDLGRRALALYRLEKRGLIKGRWVEKAGERRRRFYTLTAAGRKILAEQRRTWKDFFAALDLVAGINPA